MLMLCVDGCELEKKTFVKNDFQPSDYKRWFEMK